MHKAHNNLKEYIREVPNWPIPGINFKDITTLLQDKELFNYIVNEMSKPFINQNINKVVGIDARGFLLAAPIAYKLNSGLSIIRKKGKLPFKTIEESYLKEYGEDVITIHKDTINKGDNVLIVDDLLATGGTMRASIKLIERLGGRIIAISLIIDLPFLLGSTKLKKYKIYSLVQYDKE